MARTRIKICGICSPADAITAIEAGADAIGLVFYEKSPRNVTLEQAEEIMSVVPPFVTTVSLFVNSEQQRIEEVITRVKPDLLQFHGDEDEPFCCHFDRPYIKAVRVQADADLHQICNQYPTAKGILLDSYTKGVPGGTGEVFDWQMIPPDLALPLILAGGLNSGNVAEAIAIASPWAVDVSSGVEASPGKKDVRKINLFVQEVERAVPG